MSHWKVLETLPEVHKFTSMISNNFIGMVGILSCASYPECLFRHRNDNYNSKALFPHGGILRASRILHNKRSVSRNYLFNLNNMLASMEQHSAENAAPDGKRFDSVLQISFFLPVRRARANFLRGKFRSL